MNGIWCVLVYYCVCVVSIYECFGAQDLEWERSESSRGFLEDKVNLWCSFMLPYSQPINNVMPAVCPACLPPSVSTSQVLFLISLALFSLCFLFSSHLKLIKTLTESIIVSFSIIPLTGPVCHPVSPPLSLESCGLKAWKELSLFTNEKTCWHFQLLPNMTGRHTCTIYRCVHTQTLKKDNVQ